MNNKKKIFVVVHAHWDKEWYFTKQESDILLSKNINELILIFSNNDNYKSFTYDGQTSIIDDYLNMEPNNYKKLKEIIKNNKLIVGPWYTQPDLFNSTSESIVRNLLIGITQANEYGNSMKTAYVPDSFGQPEQMPQIFRLAGLNYLIYWRGITKERMKNSTIHFWEAPDGTKIKSVNLLKGYWVLGQFFPYDKLNSSNLYELAKKFIFDSKKIINELWKFNKLDSLLLPLGGDQAPINEYMYDFLKILNEIDEEHEWIASTYDEYYNELENINDIPTVKNELKSPQMARIHKTIASQRYDIKYILKKADYLLYYQLEPLINYFEYNDFDFNSKYIEKIIKQLLLSNAHDSLGGCNTDQTNRDVLIRIEQSIEWIESIKIKILKELGSKLNNNNILVINPRPYLTNTNFEMEIFTKFKFFEIFENKEKVEFIIIEQIKIDDGIEINVGTLGESKDSIGGYYKTKILINNLKFNGITHKILKIIQTSSSNNFLLNFKDKKIENDNWIVEITNNGTLDIINKNLKMKLLDQFKFIFVEDSGDSYDFSPASIENYIISNLIKSEANIKKNGNYFNILIKNEYKIKNLNNQIILLDVSIDNSNIIDVKVNLKNKNANIKLNCLFNTNLFNVTKSFASQAFGTTKRNLKNECLNWEEEGWAENPVPIETNENFIYLEDEKNQFGILTFGTNEYEIIGKKNNIISLTLFRSVSQLGKNNILWRPGRASGTSDFLIKTNDSKLLKNLDFTFKVILQNKDCKNFWNYANEWFASPIWYQKQDLNKYLQKFDRFIYVSENKDFVLKDNLISLDDNNLICTAFKKTIKYDKKYILRIFNPTPQTRELKINSYLQIEAELDLIENFKSSTSLKIKPNEIKTYLLSYKN